jgi:hypothetical protein
MKKSKKLAKIRPNLQRDLEMAREHLPQSMGGEGLTVPEIAERHGVSTWSVYKALAQGDVREVQKRWYEYILDEQRELGPAAVKALKGLIEAGDSTTVNAYFKRMSPPEPVAETNIEKLEIKISVEDAKRLGFQPGESVDFAEYMKRRSEEFQSEHPTPESSYHCPACSYTTEDIGQLGDHLQAAHCSESSAADEE